MIECRRRRRRRQYFKSNEEPHDDDDGHIDPDRIMMTMMMHFLAIIFGMASQN